MKCVGGEKDTFSFLNTFSSAKRRKIHNICDQLTIVHKSTFEGDLRRLVVTRVPLTPHGVICVIPSVFPTSKIPKDPSTVLQHLLFFLSSLFTCSFKYNLTSYILRIAI